MNTRKHLFPLCLVVIALGVRSGWSAIDLTAPEVIPQKSASKAQIVEIRLRFYTDGQNMMSKEVDGKTVGTAEGYIEWRTGNGDAPNFVAVSEGKSITLTAEQIGAIMLLSKTQTPTEPLVEAVGVSPVDQLFQAIVVWMKANGKL